MEEFNFQGKRKDQYESSARILFYSTVILIAATILAALM
jgi:hypothetical protein